MASTTKPEFLFLTQENIIACGGLDMALTLQEVERAFFMLGQGQVQQPGKTLLEFPHPDTGHRPYLVVSIAGLYERRPESGRD